MRKTKAAAPSHLDGPRDAATTRDVAASHTDLDAEMEGVASGVHAAAHRAAARSEEEITLRCSVEQSERLRAIAVAVAEPLPAFAAASATGEPPAPAREQERARPSQWNADEEITLDAPVPVSTPSLWPEPDDPAAAEPSDAAPAGAAAPRRRGRAPLTTAPAAAAELARDGSRVPEAWTVAGIWTVALALLALLALVVR
jgi:hypothetical protein